MTNGSRVMLAGDASARPAGLERALTRAGFLLSEAPPAGDLEPDAILVTISDSREEDLRALLAAGRTSSPPIVVVGAASDPDLPAAALALGADDALASPVHLPELCARLHARIRDRQCPRATVREGAVRNALEGLLDEGRMTLRPDEVVLALARRLARALDLRSCAFVAIDPGGQSPRVVAQVGAGPVAMNAETLDPGEHPEIAEAVRSRRPAARPGGRTTALPAVTEGRVPGVLFIERRESHPGLGSAQLEFAQSLAEAAARALESVAGAGHGNGAAPGYHLLPLAGEESLERRLQEEFERARRYSLSFSLVLLDVAAEAPRVRGELRLPDFVARYGGGEFAIVLPETGHDGARRSVVRMREQLIGPGDSSLGEPPFSAGIVTYPHPAVTQADDMFALVEAALARGRAQVGERIGIAD